MASKHIDTLIKSTLWGSFDRDTQETLMLVHSLLYSDITGLGNNSKSIENIDEEHITTAIGNIQCNFNRIYSHLDEIKAVGEILSWDKDRMHFLGQVIMLKGIATLKQKSESEE